MRPLLPIIKQPAERVIHRFEFGQPAGVAIDSLVSSSVQAAGRVDEVAPLSIVDAIVGTTYAQLRIEGGTEGELYALGALVEDEAGNRFEASAEVLVLDLSFRAAGQVAAYMTLADFIARTGVDEAVRLSDETGSGIVDARRIEAALQDAQAVVDSYLATRFEVPLALPAPAPIPTICFDLALARLHPGEPPASVRARRDASLSLLRDLAAGRAGIPLGLPATAASPAPVLSAGHDRLFTRQRLSGF